MRQRSKWTFLWILIPIAIVGILLLLSINALIDPDLYRNIIQKSLTQQLGREVTIGKARIILWDGVGIAFDEFRIRDRSQSFDLLQARRMILRARLIPLLRREIRWKRIVLDRPTLQVVRNREGEFNFSDRPFTSEGLRLSQQKLLQTVSTLFGGSLTLREGTVSFIDESFTDAPAVMEIRSLTLQLSEVAFKKAFPFRLQGKIHHSKGEGSFSLAGKIQDIQEDMDLSKGKVEVEVELKGIETLHFWPYLKGLLPLKTLSGTFDLYGRYQGGLPGPFKASTQMRFREFLLDYPEVFSFVLERKWMNLDVEVDYDGKTIAVPRISVELPEIAVKAKGRIYGMGSAEVGMEAEAQSSPFDLAAGKKLIPYGIITPEVSSALFRAEGSGPVQILSARLSGKMPEINHCDALENAHTLTVELKLDKARVKFPWDLPMFEDLQGRLLFKNGHLHLKEVKGGVFHSSFHNTNGMIYRLLHDATLQTDSEGTLDLTDLPSLIKVLGSSEESSRLFSNLQILSGTAECRQSVTWDLVPPYKIEHRGVYELSKVHFRHSEIPFRVSIGEGRVELTNEGAQWSGTKLSFGNSFLSTEGSWKRGKKEEPLEFTSQGRVDLRNLFALSQTSVIPQEIRSKAKTIEGLSGTAEFSFKGQSTGSRLSSYEARFIPRDASLLPRGLSYPVIFKEGILTFSNLGVGLSKVKVQSGNSILTWDGSLTAGGADLSSWGSLDLKQLNSLLRSSLFPDRIRSQMDDVQQLTGGADVRFQWIGKTEDWEALLKEAELRFKGVSFQHRKIPFPLSNMEGTVVFSGDQVRVSDFKGTLGDSPITAMGVVSRSEGEGPTASTKRQLSFEIFSPQLNLDSLFPKKEVKTAAPLDGIRDWLSHWSLDGKVEAEQGSYRGIHFGGLRLGMKTTEGRLFLQPFQFEALDGDLWGEGWVQPTERGIAFEIKPRVSNMEAKAFIRTVLKKGDEEKVAVTGRVHVNKVELRGEGRDFPEIKGSLNGTLRFELERGAIERANILAKIFSILNVSQLFKGRLPDLRTRGLPYHRITANILIDNGIASTEDCLVDSDAMRITMLGKVDLGKNLIDARIGIHPLVAVDAVLSNVPIAGYILTGKDRAFLSYIYEVSGSLEDPKIEAIPVKGIGEGFLGILKRLLETPLRPFQKAPLSENRKK